MTVLDNKNNKRYSVVLPNIQFIFEGNTTTGLILPIFFFLLFTWTFGCLAT